MDPLSVLFVVVLLAAFYMAWNVGANDVANAVGTSVGSHAVTVRQAVIIAAIFEFIGAFVIGDEVTNTIRKGIIDPETFADQPLLLAIGMTASLIATGVWLQIATLKGLPVSTTHAIVGAVLGFGLVFAGFETVHWNEIGRIAASWIVTPIIGGAISYGLFYIIKRYILDAINPIASLKRWAPWLVFLVLAVLLSMFLRECLHKFVIVENNDGVAYLISFLLALTGGVTASVMMKIYVVETNSREDALRRVEKVFGHIQVITACFMAMAHGSNDVANAIGPAAAVVSIIQEGVVSNTSVVPAWLLGLGGVGIVIGVATFGRRVIATIGKGITEITPTRGFSAEFGAAFTILIGSLSGLPLSTTQVLVGCVIGVGLARGIAGLNLKMIGKIMSSWIVTIPATATVSAALSFIMWHLWQ